MEFTLYQIEMLQRAIKILPIDAGEINDFKAIDEQLKNQVIKLKDEEKK